MGDNRVVLGGLALVLLLGAVAGIWLVLQDDPGPQNATAAAPYDQNEGGRDSSERIDNLDDTGEADSTPGTETDETEAQNAPATDNSLDNPDAESHRWTRHTRQFVIIGKITYRHDGRPAAGAKVRVEVYDGPGSRPAARESNVAERPAARAEGTANADGAGEFRLNVAFISYATEDELESKAAGLPATVCVIASMPDYLPARSKPLRVGPKSESTQVELKLARPTLLRGRVVDAATQDGIAGARVTLREREGGDDRRGLETGEDGGFIVDDLTAGTWEIRITAPGYLNWDGDDVIGRLHLVGGAERDIGEVALRTAGQVFGRVVVEETGDPVPGVEVRMTGTSMTVNTTRPAHTDEDGRFRIHVVEPNTYRLRARAEGYAPATVDDITVGAGDRLDIGDVKLGRGLTIRGTVRNGEGEAVGEADVSVTQAVGGAFVGRSETVGSAVTDANGAYEIHGLNAGDVILDVRADTYARYRDDIEVAPGRLKFDVTIGRGGGISGRILYADARPVARGQCLAIEHDSGTYRLVRQFGNRGFSFPIWDSTLCTQSDADGHFEIELLPAGEYLLIAQDRTTGGHYLERDNVVVRDGQITDVGDARFAEAGRVHVKVTDGGRALPGVKVRLSYRGISFGLQQGMTDSTGTALIEWLAPGDWRINIETDEGVRKDVVNVVSGQTTEYHLELTPDDQVRLFGKLTVNGEPLLREVTLKGRGVEETVSVQDGNFEFRRVKPGRYFLFAWVGERAVAMHLEVNLERPGEHQVNHDFRVFRVAGRISTPEDSPSEFAAVAMALKLEERRRYQPSGSDDGSTVVNGDGVFEFPCVPPGKYRLTTRLDGVGTASTTVEVTSGDVGGLALNIRRDSGNVRVTIRELKGETLSALTFGWAKLFDENGDEVKPPDDGDGFFSATKGRKITLRTIPPGEYTLKVHPVGYLPSKTEGVIVEVGKTTEVDVSLTAGAELHLTFTDGDVAQEALDDADVSYYDSAGKQLRIAHTMFDRLGEDNAARAGPALITKYLHEGVSEVRVKIDGYLEFTVPVQPQPGQKIEKRETLLAE